MGFLRAISKFNIPFIIVIMNVLCLQVIIFSAMNCNKVK